MLNMPTALGMDEAGFIWVYDSGNKYIRKLEVDTTRIDWFEKGSLVTMIKGVCNDLPS